MTQVVVLQSINNKIGNTVFGLSYRLRSDSQHQLILEGLPSEQKYSGLLAFGMNVTLLLMHNSMQADPSSLVLKTPPTGQLLLAELDLSSALIIIPSSMLRG